MLITDLAPGSWLVLSSISFITASMNHAKASVVMGKVYETLGSNLLFIVFLVFTKHRSALGEIPRSTPAAIVAILFSLSALSRSRSCTMTLTSFHGRHLEFVQAWSCQGMLDHTV